MEATFVLPEQCEQIGDALSRAFVDDPLCSHIFRDREGRLRKMRWIFTRWLRVMIARNGAYTTPEHNGAALWHSPEQGVHIGLWEQARAGFLLAMFQMTPAEQVRGLRAHADAMARMKRYVTTPHWTLDTLGVAPECHGRGVARALLQPVLMRADADGAPCFVNTHNGVNVPIYEHFGFKVVEASPMPGTEIIVYSMQRPPAGG